MSNFTPISKFACVLPVVFLVGCSDQVFQCDSDAVVSDVHTQTKLKFAEKLALEYRSGEQIWPVIDEQGNVDPTIDLDADDSIEQYANLQASKLHFLYGRQAHKNYLEQELTCVGRLQTPVGAEVPISYRVRKVTDGGIEVQVR